MASHIKKVITMKGLTEKLKSKSHPFWVIVILLIGIAFGYWIKGDDPEARQPADIQTAAPGENTSTVTGTNTIYACPMMCVLRFGRLLLRPKKNWAGTERQSAKG